MQGCEEARGVDVRLCRGVGAGAPRGEKGDLGWWFVARCGSSGTADLVSFQLPVLLHMPPRFTRRRFAGFALLFAIGFTGTAHAAAATKTKAKATAPAPAAPSERAAKTPGKSFVYKHSGGKPQEMEIYFPSDWEPAKRKVPGVILFHGGGWSGGTLDQFRHAGHYLASRGLVAATANYRMLTRAERGTLPAAESFKRVCITDAKSAIRWFKQKADELGIDPARIITGGGSAGGHIAVLATLNPGLNDPADPAGIDTSVAAYLLFNPAFDPKDHGDRDVDVLAHLTAKLPPAILFFGTKDQWKAGSEAALRRLAELGNQSAEMWLADEQGHSFFNRPPWQDITLHAADRFLVEHGFLQGPPTLPAPPAGQELKRAGAGK